MPILSLLRESNTAHIMSDNITMQYVLEMLSNGFQAQSATVTAQQGQVPGTTVVSLSKEACSIIVADEFSVFIHDPNYDLPNLNKLWDGGEGKVDYGTRGKGLFSINNPCQTLLAGSAPEYLVRCVPQSAVGGGFTRRVNFVYAQGAGKRRVWPVVSKQRAAAIVDDLRDICSNINGKFEVANAARSTFEVIYNSSVSGDYDDEATANYKTSIWAHALKIGMCLSAARGASMEISKDDLDEAMARIEVVVKDIPRVFRAVGDSDLAMAADRVMKFVEIRGMASEADILAACHKHVSDRDLSVILSTLVKGRVLIEKMHGPKVLYMTAGSVAVATAKQAGQNVP
jgi:hypothetical protein